ncbi:hypothetical protein KP509_01G002400 [Ceratopteris richardii]|uniref:Thaumatin-like protein n=1 Tax=Ceratopteris richardii TaxID=49495 RepID=A0A8T2VHL2_CERRI|nr:hypothetical protein KP509_01G002400 [Ceratopteris richardii]
MTWLEHKAIRCSMSLYEAISFSLSLFNMVALMASLLKSHHEPPAFRMQPVRHPCPPLPTWPPVVLIHVRWTLVSSSPIKGDTSIRIKNSCGYDIWPAILTGVGNAPTATIEEMPSGFMLTSGHSMTIHLPQDWSGRFWGRTGCDFSSDGEGECETGDCGRRLNCTGVGATPPATLVEFSIHGQRSQRDFYDVSLVDGFNLPVSVAPTGGSSVSKANQSSCVEAICAADLNKVCPSILQMIVKGRVVGCKSACLALKSDMYCCAGAYSNPNTCNATSYSKAFKSRCPTAYTYAYDDATSLFTCASASAYTITFCPPSSSSSSLTSVASFNIKKGMKMFVACTIIFVIMSIYY